MYVFFFQAEDGIRDRSPSRGLGDVYKRQDKTRPTSHTIRSGPERNSASVNVPAPSSPRMPVVRKATIAATSNGCRTGAIRADSHCCSWAHPSGRSGVGRGRLGLTAHGGPPLDLVEHSDFESCLTNLTVDGARLVREKLHPSASIGG